MTENWDELCDEELSFNKWINDNGYAIFLDTNRNLKEMLKTSYMKGYAAGFDAKGKHSAEEQLQK
jgi:hypothetical protein